MKAAKKALRRQLRQTRRALPATERAQAQAACNRALKTFIRRGKNIAVYWAMGGELDLHDWVQAALKRGANVYLPYIEPRSLRLWFTPYPRKAQRAERKRGQSSLHVPQFRGKKIRAERLHKMLIPIVGIDRDGIRLGQGGGYYDCTINACRTRRPQTVAVGFACQQIDRLPREAHDIRTDYFASERGIQKF